MAQLQSLSIAGETVVDYIVDEGTWAGKVTKNNIDYDTTWNYRKYSSGYIEMWTSGTAASLTIGTGRNYDWKAELPFSVIYNNKTRLNANVTSNTTALWCGHIYLDPGDGTSTGVTTNTQVDYICWSTWNNGVGSTPENNVNWNLYVGAQLA